ncbi:hypothetical protein EJB05_19262, partial [Eragrostis curvula]
MLGTAVGHLEHRGSKFKPGDVLGDASQELKLGRASHQQLEGFRDARVAELGQILQTRGVLDDDPVHPHLGNVHWIQGMRGGESESSESGGVDHDFGEAHALVEHECHKVGAARDQSVEGGFRDVDAAERDQLEVREAKRWCVGGGGGGGECAVADPEGAQRRSEPENGRRRSSPSPVDAGLPWLDLEHLKAVEGAGPEPEVVLGGVAGDVDGLEPEAAGEAGVHREDVWSDPTQPSPAPLLGFHAARPNKASSPPFLFPSLRSLAPSLAALFSARQPAMVATLLLRRVLTFPTSPAPASSSQRILSSFTPSTTAFQQNAATPINICSDERRRRLVNRYRPS